MRSPIAAEAYPLLVALAALHVVVFAFSPVWSLPLTAALAFSLWFFRDPQRDVPQDPQALVAPADGKLIRAADGRISIFMNVFDVHVCRAPWTGTVRAAEHHAGRFLAAWNDDAPRHNERVVIDVDGRAAYRFVLIAGLIARRIVCRVEPGQRVQTGERVGLIKFGSRVDLHLPPGAEIAVRAGQRVRAGETVLARLPSDPI